MIPLAKKAKLGTRYVGQLLPLACLAPDIIEAIQKGEIPPCLSLDRLKKGFSNNWTEQRKQLGFS